MSLFATYVDGRKGNGNIKGLLNTCKACASAYAMARYRKRAALPRVEMEPTIKTCRVCGQEKSTTLFTKSAGRLLNTCKMCNSEYTMKRYRERCAVDPAFYERSLAKEKARHHTYVQLVFDHYGRECECCGETEMKFLTVDHIKEIRSYKQRTEMGHNWMYRWLVKNNFPPGYRILCSNCNFGRSRNGGVCPHQEGSQAIAQASSRKCGEVPEAPFRGHDMVEAAGKPVAVLPSVAWAEKHFGLSALLN